MKSIIYQTVYWLNDILRHRSVYKKYRFYQKNYARFTINYREEKLAKLLQYAGQYIPYYRKLFKDNKIEGIKDFNDIPILTKNIIKKTGLEKFTYPENRKYDVVKTSGTTGQPTTFWVDSESISAAFGAQLFFWEKYGYKFGDRIVNLWGGAAYLQSIRNLKKRVLKKIKNEFTIPSHLLNTEAGLNQAVILLNQIKPQVITAYSYSLYQLSQYIYHTKTRLSFRPKFIITTAETITLDQRQFIENVFGAPTYDQYGSNEVLGIAFECPNKTGYHIHVEHIWLELLPGPQNTYRIIVTDLDNYVMPLIRYETGDIVLKQLLNNPCYDHFGDILPFPIVGRLFDIIQLPSGEEVNLMPTLIAGLKTESYIEKFQLHYYKRQNTFELQIVVNSSYQPTRHNERIINIFKENYSDIQLNIKVVNALLPESNGKFKLIKVHET
ncbi:phenylacetate--CoA ligase family protein [Lutibacter sp.]